MSFPHNTATVALDFPLKLAGGAILHDITMRSPTVRDRLCRTKDNRTDVEADLHMIAALCGLQSEDLMEMEASDYLRLERQFNVFLLPVAMRKKAASLPVSDV